MTDPINHLNKVSGRRFFSHNTEPERGREEGGEEEREICTICNFFTFTLLVKMYVNTLNIWITYDQLNSVSRINNKYIVTGSAALSSFQVQGEAGDCQGETLTMEYTIVSSHPHVVCLSLSSSSRCVQNHYNRPTLVSRKKPVLVFGYLSAPQRQVCRFTMHLCHLKQTLDKR